MQPQKNVIGRVEVVDFPELELKNIHARIDTGANTSAIWVSQAGQEGERLRVVFFGEGSEHFSGQPVYFENFTQTVVASSNGQSETRYKVKILVRLNGRRIRGQFTLADRSQQAYPVLIGRNVLRGKFVVDVQDGKPLYHEERQRSSQLQSKLTPKEQS